MNNDYDIINNPKIKKILSELKAKVHIPFELIVADVEGKLSDEGHSKIALHIDACKECAEVLRCLKEYFGSQDADEKSGSTLNISIDAKLGPKLKLIAIVNSKKDKIIKQTVQLLLSKDFVFPIEPAITVYRKWLKTSIEFDLVDAKELPVAAFSGGFAEDKENFEVVVAVIKFVDYISDLLVERCNNLEEIQNKLSGFVGEAWYILDELKVDKTTRNSILTILENYFEKS